MTGVEGKRVAITGAGNGLGSAIAKRYAAGGAQLALLDRDGDAVADVATELGAHPFVADVTDAGQVADAMSGAIAELGGLDVLVNDAGVEIVGPLLQVSDEDIWRAFDVNVLGAIRCARAAVPALSDGGGAIVTMSSAAGVGGSPLLGAYSMAKAAVIRMTETLAFELRALGVRANAVCPALIGPTRMVDALVEPFEQMAGVPFDQILRRQGRIGLVEEVAELVAFLGSDESSLVNGAHYLIDGGMTAALL